MGSVVMEFGEERELRLRGAFGEGPRLRDIRSAKFMGAALGEFPRLMRLASIRSAKLKGAALGEASRLFRALLIFWTRDG
jgi:hypothetical protein